MLTYRSIRRAVVVLALSGAPAVAVGQYALPLRVAATPVQRSGAALAPRAVAAALFEREGHSGAVRRGAVLGAVIGGGVGALTGVATRCGALKDPIDGDCLSVSSASLIGGAIGVVAGAAVGAVIGAVRAGSLRGGT